MKKSLDLTQGSILSSLTRFAVPVFFALALQALYGAVDMLVVGQFAETADVSGVASGSMLMHMVTGITTGLASGITVLVGQRVGERQPEKAGRAIGAGICLFAVFAVVLTALLAALAPAIAKIMQAPEEAFSNTVSYIRICGLGSVFIVAYNLLGSIFRGLGDSKTPLVAVAIACVLNIFGDLLFVWGFGLGAAGAALATVISQAVSVLLSALMIRRKQLPVTFNRKMLRFDGECIKAELRLGVPVGTQELLVGFSFVIMQTVVNTFGMVASAAAGVGEKVCIFLLLVPMAYMQAMSAFTAQNMGAGKPERAKKAIWCSMATALSVGIVMTVVAFVWGNLLASVFDSDPEVISNAHLYLKSYSLDCIVTAIMFCFMGYFIGRGKTVFTMLTGVFGAFAVRGPLSYLFSLLPGASLFHIGLATPISTAVQMVACIIMYIYMERKEKTQKLSA